MIHKDKLEIKVVVLAVGAFSYYVLYFIFK